MPLPWQTSQHRSRPRPALPLISRRCCSRARSWTRGRPGGSGCAGRRRPEHCAQPPAQGRPAGRRGAARGWGRGHGR
ncbi:unnamed protein product, partial [Heterosigma akashiwo]